MSRYKTIAIHENFQKLIEKVSQIFKAEYGIEPTIIDITKLIALRVEENNLFK